MASGADDVGAAPEAGRAGEVVVGAGAPLDEGVCALLGTETEIDGGAPDGTDGVDSIDPSSRSIMVMIAPSASSTDARNSPRGDAKVISAAVAPSVVARDTCHPGAGAMARMLSTPADVPTVTVPPSPMANTCDEVAGSTLITDVEAGDSVELVDVAARRSGNDDEPCDPLPPRACALTNAAAEPARSTPATETMVASRVFMGSTVRSRSFPSAVRTSKDRQRMIPKSAEASSRAAPTRSVPTTLSAVHILLVEDDRSIAVSLIDGLQAAGYTVTHAATGAAALQAPPADAVLLDLGLPDIDGRDVCRALRSRSNVPIIMLTARGDEFDRVLGLELGADDYVTKPFSFRELVARIRAVTRRSAATESSGDSNATQMIGPLEIDRRTRRVRLQGVEVMLTAKEFDLLAYLAIDPGAVFTRTDILENVWDVNWFGPTKTVDAHVAAIRKKLGDQRWIEAVRGIGFRLEQPG